MKYVNFEKLSIINFLSIGSEPVVVDFRAGLNIITGINKDKVDRRNGVGKSTIADALHFAIFGSTIRELKKENIINNQTRDTCEVELKFNVVKNEKVTNYRVVRMLEPSRCRLFINGEDKTRDSIAHTTEYICKIISASPEIFQNSVIMTVNNTVPFMAKKKIEKRKFIEGIFNLEVFSDMLSSLRQEYNDAKRQFDIESSRGEEVESTLHSHNLQKKKFVEDKKQRKEKLQNRQGNNDKELEQLKNKIVEVNLDELKTIKSKISTLDDNVDICDTKKEDTNKNITTLESEIKFAKQKMNEIGTDKDQCPVCLKPVSQHDRNEIDKEKDTIQSDIDSKNKSIQEYIQSINTLNDLKTKLKSAINSQTDLYNDSVLKVKDNKNTADRIEQLKTWQSQLQQDLKNFDTDTKQYDQLIKQTKDRLDQIDKSITKIRHTLAVLDVVKFVVSEEGVKSYIDKKILQIFNSKLYDYLQKMDANCLCLFNEYFEEEIVDEKGKMCSYFNFSGAERKNIDLACLFAFMDIRRLQGHVAYNVSVYDELLDTSLDERGVDLVLDILRERVEKNNECVMVISHRKESIKIGTHYKNTGEIIYLQKENGITRRVAFSDE